MKPWIKKIIIGLTVTAIAGGTTWLLIIPKIKVASIPHIIEEIKDRDGFNNSIIVVDAKYENDPEKIININSEKLIHPGSNYKLLTAAASLNHLGPEFTFKTHFYTFDQNGRKHLVIEGQGDPTWHHEDIREMVRELKKRRISITGNLHYDAKYFIGEPYGPDWKPEWKDIHFAVPITALQMDDNLLYIRGKGKSMSTAALNNYRPIVDNRKLVTTPPPYKISGKMLDNGTVSIEGETSGNNEFITSVVMRNPALITAQVFKQELLREGMMSASARVIDASGNSQLNRNIPIKLQYTHESKPLKEIIQQMLTYSKNNYGETLIRVLGKGNQKEGARLLKTFLVGEIGINPNDFIGVDGSGMSPSSRITGRAIMQLFEYVNRQTWKEVFWDALPTSNNEGTLHYRFLGENLEYPIIAKTGTHEFASSLSGKIPRKKNTILFSVHIFNHQIGYENVGSQVQPIIDRIIKLLIERL